jgi:hypothetical protein
MVNPLACAGQPSRAAVDGTAVLRTWRSSWSLWLVVALLAALELWFVLVALLVAVFVLPCFEICVSRWRRCQRWSRSYL